MLSFINRIMAHNEILDSMKAVVYPSSIGIKLRETSPLSKEWWGEKNNIVTRTIGDISHDEDVWRVPLGVKYHPFTNIYTCCK